jgi:hypothetical protein
MAKGLEKHIKAHCRRTSRGATIGGFYVVEKPMQVFKRINFGKDYDKAIASMIIPVGERIYVHGEAFTSRSKTWYGTSIRKMRCSKAYVYQIADWHGDKLLNCGFSTWNDWGNRGMFRYRVGRNVVPRAPFSTEFERCASGIHFFVNLEDAKQW